MTKRSQIDQAALVRSMAVRSPCDFMWLLGAGASVTSGIKSASQCVWTWKRQLFLTAHPDTSPALFADTTDRGVQDRIQQWIDSVPGSPPRWDPSEYGYFIERCYPRAEDRRRSLESIVRAGSPGPGYRLLGRMIRMGHFRWFWTTNFDDMLTRAIPADFPRPVRKCGMDTTHRLRSTAERDDYVNVVHLHGDYRYDTLRNTAAELRSLDREYAEELARLLGELPLVVIGYSGSDESVMRALEDAYSRRGRGSLYWLTLNGSEPNARVQALVSAAQENGHDAFMVTIDGFDDFVRRTAQLLLPTDEVAQLVKEARENAEQARPPFQHERYPGQTGIAKSNTWSLKLPEFYWSCAAPHIGSWKELRRLQGDAPVSAGLLFGRLVALGDPAAVARLGGVSQASVERIQFSQDDLRSDSVLHGVVRDYVIRALASGSWMIGTRRGRHVLYQPSAGEPVKGFPGVRWCRAAELDLHFHADAPVLTLLPDRHVFCEDSKSRVPSGAWEVVNRELSRQWNQKFNQEFNDWRKALGVDGDLVIGLGDDTNTSVIRVCKGPRFAKLVSPDPNVRPKTRLGDDIVKLEGFQLREPALQFGGGSDTHPLRGLLESGPAELLLPRLPQTDLRLGVVVPERVDNGIDDVLRELVDGHRQVETRNDYQVSYPGFENAFRTRLRVGSRDGVGRITFATALSGGSPVAQQREALDRVCECIDRAAAASASVVFVVFPHAWERLAEVDDENRRRLDFHDLVKAHAAPRGIRTQMFRERTPKKRQRLEVLWWLALAVYAKSNRVPWTLSSTSDTVHVGIGYGLDPADRTRPVLMCCSHIYQSSGLGLRFQLSEIGDPVFLGGRQRNPYLKHDDAYRVGTKALQVVVEASERFPKRVCISKRTRFTPDERMGFLSALKQVPEVELLTIEMDESIRLIRAKPDGGDADSFPVPRGTVVPYGDHEALVWVHGDVVGVSSQGDHYYQGKSRIPAPLRITRYAGSASLEELAADLLGLSKMDWNSFDLYGKVPVQLTSPARIARVAKLMGDIRLEDRDYRLFM